MLIIGVSEPNSLEIIAPDRNVESVENVPEQSNLSEASSVSSIIEIDKNDNVR